MEASYREHTSHYELNAYLLAQEYDSSVSFCLTSNLLLKDLDSSLISSQLREDFYQVNTFLYHNKVSNKGGVFETKDHHNAVTDINHGSFF